jgi:ankyrin repeat protein
MLLDAGAKIEARGLTGKTPLIVASSRKSDSSHEVVALLLRYGANPNAADSSKSTALHAGANDPAVIAMLLQAGASVNAQDSIGRTPLDGCYNVDAARALLDGGADPNIVAADGESTYSRTLMRSRDEKLAQLLFDKGGRLTAAQTGRLLRNAAIAPFMVALIMLGQRH